MALERGFINAGQLEKALEERLRIVASGATPVPSVGSILVQRGHLTEDQRNTLLGLQESYS